MSKLDLSCPKCGSENTQSYAMIYQQGISGIDLDTHSLGAGYQFGEDGGSFIFGSSGRASGVSQSSLSKLTAPPRRTGSGFQWPITIGIILLLISIPIWSASVVAGVVYSTIVILLLVLWIRAADKAIKVADGNYRRRYQEWESSYLCLRCGQSFGVKAKSSHIAREDSAIALAAMKKGDYASAFKTLEPLAEQGNAGAQFILGKMYHNGLGVSSDLAKAVSWYRMAADQGHSDAKKALRWPVLKKLDQSQRGSFEWAKNDQNAFGKSLWCAC